jgi:hypothetical protein
VARAVQADDARFNKYIEDVLVPAADAGCVKFDQCADAVEAYFNFPGTDLEDSLIRILAAAKRHGIRAFHSPWTEMVTFSWYSDFYTSMAASWASELQR